MPSAASFGRLSCSHPHTLTQLTSPTLQVANLESWRLPQSSSKTLTTASTINSHSIRDFSSFLGVCPRQSLLIPGSVASFVLGTGTAGNDSGRLLGVIVTARGQRRPHCATEHSPLANSCFCARVRFYIDSYIGHP